MLLDFCSLWTTSVTPPGCTRNGAALLRRRPRLACRSQLWAAGCAGGVVAAGRDPVAAAA